MHAWEQIQKTLDYMEDHLDEEINIESFAKMASLSPFYYQRLFSRLVKKPVAEYVRLRRLAKATDDLKNKDRRILDIALELGFSSHEHFSRAFKDTFGMTPDEYRKNPQTLNRMTKPELLLHYTLIDEGYFNYFAGAKKSTSITPDGYKNWELPQGDYIVCTFEAENFESLVMDALYKAQQYLYNIWIPNHKLQTDTFCAERYASHTPETTSMEVWLKLVK